MSRLIHRAAHEAAELPSVRTRRGKTGGVPGPHLDAHGEGPVSLSEPRSAAAEQVAAVARSRLGPAFGGGSPPVADRRSACPPPRGAGGPLRRVRAPATRSNSPLHADVGGSGLASVWDRRLLALPPHRAPHAGERLSVSCHSPPSTLDCTR